MTTAPSLPLIRLRLAQLAAHLVVALIALVVVGGATRVMEAGLACPDWPLCYGSFLPGRKMNIQVFLEWFHRLDAFLVGIALLIQFLVSLIRRVDLPRWIPWVNGFLLILVLMQGGLGAVTVLQLLPSGVVTAHLAIALALVAVMSGVTQKLLSPGDLSSPLWWKLMGGGSLMLVIGQCLLGGRMATTWAAQRCLEQGQSCLWLDLHRNSAVLVFICVFAFVITALLVGGWPRCQWPYLLPVILLLFGQLGLGDLSVRLGLDSPVVTVCHQFVAVLLVAFLAALSFRSPYPSFSKPLAMAEKSIFSPCHG